MAENYHFHTDGSPLGCYHSYLDPSLAGHVRQDVIDPSLSSDPDSMKRFLHDPHQPILNMHTSQAYQYTNIYYNAGQPLPPQTQGRGGSPFSQNQSSNTSSALSPRTESDQLYESVNGPPTPPNTMGSPFLSPSWGGDPMALTGISPCLTAEPYVNLSDINPSSFVAMSEELSGPKNSIFDSAYCGAVTAPHSSFLSPPSPLDEIHVRTSPSPEYPDLENGGDTIIVEPSAEALQTTQVLTAGRRRGRPRRVNENPLTRPAKVTKSTLPNSRRLPSTSSNSLVCTECSEGFKDDASLRKHIKTQHKRPFICVFRFAGCSDAFASKNEWKRHVAAQHLNLNFWLCTSGNCGESSSRGSKSGAFGRPFRRKDLYTQHIRRMHLDEGGSTDNSKNRKNTPEYLDAQVREMQEKAFKQRCAMPQYMRCPATGCSQDFRGAKAWDERMEHVARHLEAAAAGAEPRVEFGGPHDDTLTNWASSKEVQVISWNSDSWECCQPLKNTKGNVMKLSRHVSDSDGESYVEDSY